MHIHTWTQPASAGPADSVCGETGSVAGLADARWDFFYFFFLPALGAGSNRLGGFDSSPKKQTLVEARLASTPACYSVTAD